MARCFCHAIPLIENRTGVAILQHGRERFHAFNTARIVRKALAQCELIVGHQEPALLREIAQSGEAGLLYPSAQALPIEQLPPSKRPNHLVVIDGTWHHARTMYRDMPALHDLPCYRLAPKSPGRYRIRKEPNAYSLSTLEATVAALQALEPETQGFQQLLNAFETMVEAQLAHPKEQWRRNRRRSRTPLNIPVCLIDRLQDIVVAYGEAAPACPGTIRGQQQPLYWVAERIATGERFTQVIGQDQELSERFLQHLKLEPEFFRMGGDLKEFRQAWSSYLRPTDILAVYHPSTQRMLANAGAVASPCIALKSIEYAPFRGAGALEDRIQKANIQVAPAIAPGRAGERLAMAKALVMRLHEIGRQWRLQPENIKGDAGDEAST